MPHYRVHILDSSGKLIGAGQFDCADSETAQERIRQLAGDLDTELWQLISPVESSIKRCSGASQAGPRIRRRLDS
jgi:hypothetical protein